MTRFLRVNQDLPSNPYQALPDVFPQPTGKNGYEDLIAASDLLRRSKLYQEAELKPTLSSRRQALADPLIRQARVLVENAFSKPILPPQREMNLATTFPEMAGFRSVARLLNHEMYVFFAEGRTTYALNDLVLGLKLGSVPKGNILIGGLVGIAIDSIVLTRVMKHLEQLSYRDCDRVMLLLREHREADQLNAFRSLDTENQSYNTILKELEKDFKGTTGVFVEEPTTDEDGTPPDPAAVASYRRTKQQVEAIAQNPAAQRQVIEAVRQAAARGLLRSKAYLQDPSKLPPPATPLPAGSLESTLSDASLPNSLQIVERFTTDRLNVQLLATHAAIRKFKWEQEKLPDSLDTLRLGELAMDPYTKQPLRYENKGEGYELYSVGPFARDEEGHPQAKRAPVFLPYRKPS